MSWAKRSRDEFEEDNATTTTNDTNKIIRSVDPVSTLMLIRYPRGVYTVSHCLRDASAWSNYNELVDQLQALLIDCGGDNRGKFLTWFDCITAANRHGDRDSVMERLWRVFLSLASHLIVTSGSPFQPNGDVLDMCVRLFDGLENDSFVNAHPNRAYRQ